MPVDPQTIQAILTGSGAALFVLAGFVWLFVNGDIISKKTYERIVSDVTRDIAENMQKIIKSAVKEEFSNVKSDIIEVLNDSLRERGRTRL